MNKQISITLEQIRQGQTIQHHSDHGFTTEQIELPTVYEVIKLQNAVVIDLGSFGPNKIRTIRIGDRLNEKQADEIARTKRFNVTIIK